MNHEILVGEGSPNNAVIVDISSLYVLHNIYIHVYKYTWVLVDRCVTKITRAFITAKTAKVCGCKYIYIIYLYIYYHNILYKSTATCIYKIYKRWPFSHSVQIYDA